MCNDSDFIHALRIFLRVDNFSGADYTVFLKKLIGEQEEFVVASDIFASVNELKEVLAKSPNVSLFTAIPEKFSAEVLNAAKLDRDKMIEILNQFYKNHCRGFKNVDDFVTLFGVYCNYYILCGLHLVLKEDDFGTSKIFEKIKDDSLKKYLSLIRSGIVTQDYSNFEAAVKENEDYSLAHFYLFLRYLRQYWEQPYDKVLEEELLEQYKAIRNDKLRNYAVGRSELFPRLNNYMMELMKNQIAAIVEQFFDPEIVNELMGTGDKTFDAPPLPCPYLITTEEMERMGCFFSAYLSYIHLTEIYCACCGAVVCYKEFSEVLSFIASKVGIWSEDEARSGLLNSFKESKTHSSIAKYVYNILFTLPLYLEGTEKFLHNLGKGEVDFSSLAHFFDVHKQSELIYAELNSDEQKKVSTSKYYSELENTEFKPEIGSRYMFNRSWFLDIPYRIDWTNQELYTLLERISIQSEKDTMVRDYMHTYSNMTATTLYDIAQLLLKRDNREDKENGRKLLMEYALKREVKNSVYMMQLMYKSHNEDLKEQITKSLVDEDDDHDSVSDILNKSLRQFFINVFYVKPSDKTQKMHDNLQEVWEENFREEKRDSFEQQVMEQDSDCMEWLLREGINFTCEQDAVWRKVFMEKDGFSSTFLKIIFDELFVNLFKYGDLNEAIRLVLSGNENEDLVISLSNCYIPRSRESGTQRGINLLRRRVQILHEDAKKVCVEVSDDTDKGNFQIKLFLPAGLFLS